MVLLGLPVIEMKINKVSSTFGVVFIPYIGIVCVSSYTENTAEFENLDSLVKQRDDLVKLQNNVDESLQKIFREQLKQKHTRPNDQSKVNKTEIHRSRVSLDKSQDRKSPAPNYSHIGPRVFSHLPEEKRPRQLTSKSPKPNKSFRASFMNTPEPDIRPSLGLSLDEKV